MIDGLSLHNLAVWIGQVFILTSAGAVLPRLFRLKHPRSTLVYYRVLLIIALLLPFIQPTRPAVVVVTQPSAPAAAETSAFIAKWSASTTAWSSTESLFGVIALGFLIRLCWVAGGLCELRRLRNSSTVLYPLGDAIQNARRV